LDEADINQIKNENDCFSKGDTMTLEDCKQFLLNQNNEISKDLIQELDPDGVGSQFYE